MKKRLTKSTIDKLEKRAARYIVWDDRVTGFGVRVGASGEKVFVLKYRFPSGRAGKVRWFTIGTYSDDLPPDRARERAEVLRGDIRRGNDPMGQLQEQRREAEAMQNAPTLEGIAREYIERVAKKEKQNRAWKEQLRTFEHDIFPTLGRRPISEIKRSEIVRLFEAMDDRGSSGQANEALKQLRACMAWYALRDDDFVSPIVKGMRRRPTLKRDRVLSDVELAAMWRALEASPAAFRFLVRFVTLTALRKGEAANARWGWLKGDALVIPATEYKTKIEHVAPLTDFARSQLEELGQPDPPKPMRYMFTTNGHDAPQGFGKWKAELDAEMLRIMRETDPNAELKEWQVRDLRRTARTLMSRAGVSSEHAERVLGHVIAGVEGVYDRHDYIAEKRDALERLGRLVQLIVTPCLREALAALSGLGSLSTAKVVPFARKRRGA